MLGGEGGKGLERLCLTDGYGFLPALKLVHDEDEDEEEEEEEEEESALINL